MHKFLFVPLNGEKPYIRETVSHYDCAQIESKSLIVFEIESDDANTSISEVDEIGQNTEVMEKQ